MSFTHLPDEMEITIETDDPLPDGRRRVSFATRFGSAQAIWRGSHVRRGDTYQVELTVLDELEVGRNADLIHQEAFALAMIANLIVINARVESVDPDGVSGMRLGDDCLFLADFVNTTPEPRQWLGIRLPPERLELWPYDSGSMTIVER